MGQRTRKAHKRSRGLRDQEIQEALVREQRSLHDQVRTLHEECLSEGIQIPRELFAVMATTEALTDELVDAGLIDRASLNNRRFRYLTKYLKKELINVKQPEAATP